MNQDVENQLGGYEPQTTPRDIATGLLDLAQEIAERRHVTGVAIESLSDQLLPHYDNEGHAAVVQDAVESWAYEWLEYLQGGISQPDRGDAMRALMGLPLGSGVK